MSKSRTDVKKTGKRERVPFSGHRTKLQLSDRDMKALTDAGYVPRWFNDQDGRVQAAESGGWVHVDEGEARSVGSTDLNGKVSKIVSKGGGTPVTGFLLKIKKEFYNEDQERKEDRNRLVDDALRSGQPGGNVVENQYVPDGHKQQI